MITAIAAKRSPERRSALSMRLAKACSRVFSASSRPVSTTSPLATAVCPVPASVPAASTTRAATSVVPSTSIRLAAA